MGCVPIPLHGHDVLHGALTHTTPSFATRIASLATVESHTTEKVEVGTPRRRRNNTTWRSTPIWDKLTRKTHRELPVLPVGITLEAWDESPMLQF